MAGDRTEESGARLLALAGSMREASFNRRLLAVAVKAAESGGAQVDVAVLRELALPLYDGDLEAGAGPPEAVERFKARIAAVDGLIIASPEYNHSIPGGLKNAIDWASRGPDRVFPGKAALLLGASPGGFGAARGLPHLRQVMAAVGVWTVPTMVTLSSAGSAFDDNGALVNENTQQQVEAAVGQLLEQLMK